MNGMAWSWGRVGSSFGGRPSMERHGGYGVFGGLHVVAMART